MRFAVRPWWRMFGAETRHSLLPDFLRALLDERESILIHQLLLPPPPPPDGSGGGAGGGGIRRRLGQVDPATSDNIRRRDDLRRESA